MRAREPQGVRALVGRLEQRGDTLTVSAELIDTRDDSQLWGGRFERPMSEALAVQEEITREVTRNLRLQLTGEEETRLLRRATENIEAYQLYLRGRVHWEKRTKEGLLKSIEFYNQAIEKDPSYALAFTGIADTYSTLGNNRFLPPDQTFPRARAAAQKALELDENLTEAHVAHSFVLRNYDRDWAGSEREARRAIELNPGYALGRMNYAFLLSILGRHDEAVQEQKEARAADPLSPRINANVGHILYWARRYDEAIEDLHNTLAADPQNYAAYWYLGRAYLMKGQPDEAIAAFQKWDEIAQLPIPLQLARAYAKAGRRADARKILDEALELSKEQYIAPGEIGQVYLALDEREAALRWFEKAFETRATTANSFGTGPDFDPIRDDPRFQALLRRMNFPEQAAVPAGRRAEVCFG